MSRAKYANVVEVADPTTTFLKRLGGAKIYVYEPGTTTPVAQTLYQENSGVATHTNYFLAEDDGTFEFYLDRPQRVSLKITHPLWSDVNIDFEPVIPDLPIYLAYRVFAIVDYGAVGDGSDATVGINEATRLMLLNTSQPGGILLFHPGDFPYDNTLSTHVGTYYQLQARYGYIIRGSGMLTSKWYPAVRTDKWEGKAFVSMAGAHNCGIEDISIGIAAVAAQSFPSVFLLWAQSSTNGSNALWMRNVRVEGAAKWGFYNYAVPSSHISNLHVYNRECTEATHADAGNVVDGAAVMLSRENTTGIGAIGGTTFLNNTHGAAWTARSMSDLDVDRWEIHDLTSLAGTANACGLLLYQVTNLRAKGNISSNGTMVKVAAPPAADAVMTDNIALEITEYREDLGGGAGLTPLYGVYFTNVFSHGSPQLIGGRVNLTNSRIDLKTGDTAAAVIKADAGWTINRPTLRSWTPLVAFTGKVLDITNNAGNVLTYPDIDCCGLDLSVGASGTATIDVGGLTNPGTVTAGTLNYRSRIGSGTAALPSYSWLGNTSDGMYHPVAANQVGFATNGVGRVVISDTQTYFQDGSGSTIGGAAVAGISFLLDGTAGLNRPGTNRLGFVNNNVLSAEFDASGALILKAAPATPTANGGYREGFAKGAVKFNVSGTILFDYNVLSITDSGAGNWTVLWDRDFASADYAAQVSVETSWTGSTGAILAPHINAMAAGTTQVVTPRITDAALTDPGGSIHVTAHGTQA